MHRSGGKAPSAGSVSTSASPVRLLPTAGRSPSSADAYVLFPISTAYERRGSGRRTTMRHRPTISTGAPNGTSGTGAPLTLSQPRRCDSFRNHRYPRRVVGDRLANIDGTTNAVVCEASPVGEIAISGPGAGPQL